MTAPDLDVLRGSPYAWQGGYPVYAVLDDGGILCRECVSQPEVHVGGDADGWRVDAVEILWEGEELCAHCGKTLECAYPDD
jgi:hypothetical protein